MKMKRIDEYFVKKNDSKKKSKGKSESASSSSRKVFLLLDDLITGEFGISRKIEKRSFE
jgi:hypothetical protein